MLRTFIQVFALLLTFFAGVLLVRGSFVLSSSDIAGLSSTRWGHNPSMVKNLSQQQCDTKTGMVLLVISAILQMANLLWPMRFCDFAVNKVGIILAIIISVTIFVLAIRVSNILRKNVQKEVTTILEQGK
jgi:energy-coupling factor transporter transmembrane protein EcfT